LERSTLVFFGGSVPPFSKLVFALLLCIFLFSTRPPGACLFRPSRLRIKPQKRRSDPNFLVPVCLPLVCCMRCRPIPVQDFPNLHLFSWVCSVDRQPLQVSCAPLLAYGDAFVVVFLPPIRPAFLAWVPGHLGRFFFSCPPARRLKTPTALAPRPCRRTFSLKKQRFVINSSKSGVRTFMEILLGLVAYAFFFFSHQERSVSRVRIILV